MKTISCIREKKDQYKIDQYEQLLKNNATEFNQLSNIVGLIGNGVRLKLVWLINQEQFCVCDFADILQMSVPAISQHLRKLKDVGIVETFRDKQTIYYSITPTKKLIVNHILDLVSDEIAVTI
ncbi:metalloregulator ArsR/SmtB family transcription factor [Lutibacter sp.]|uniref:ArsR/SmtB family transcription factor n=1 Tax=Lutibacter sp. TaxID=1925666 RepID=UPI0025BCEE06|nr:metalloregulator ArsR/SmtB family transcription factor [Lutibacter sp.]MCF6182852.1 metalloregulator ArsR/SmtB family transcription factor [Lutibacter sp.]